jgi:putative colanic acid biosynthesis acetyltransferase WcaF
LTDVPVLNLAANRAAAKYTRLELGKRVLWAFTRPLFRFSPRPFFGWRRLLLRVFGAQVGGQVHIYPSAVIYMPWNLIIGEWSSIGEDVLVYNLGSVRIGRGATISHRAHLCAGTHDYEDPAMQLLKPPISIGDSAWVCAGAFVGPGITVGEGAVVGASAVVVKDVPPWTVVVGNPARVLKSRRLRGRAPDHG